MCEGISQAGMEAAGETVRDGLAIIADGLKVTARKVQEGGCCLDTAAKELAEWADWLEYAASHWKDYG